MNPTQQILGKDSTIKFTAKQQNQNQKPQREKFAISIEKHAKFNANGSTEFLTTRDLSGFINDVFATIFEDYHGCRCRCKSMNTPYGNSFVIIPEIYFKVSTPVSGPDAIRGFKPASTDTDILAKLQRQSMGYQAPQADMTQELKDILGNFTIKSVGNSNPKIEFEPIYSREEGCVMVLKNLNIDQILGMVYGKGDNSENYVYNARASMPLQNNGGNDLTQANWICQVTRINAKLMNDIGRILGVNTNTSGLGEGFVKA